MALKKLQKKLQILWYLFSVLSSINPKTNPDKKAIYFDIHSNPFDRHLYIFLKMLSLRGYEIQLPKRPRLIYELLSDRYARYILEDLEVRWRWINGRRVPAADTIKQPQLKWCFEKSDFGKSAQTYTVPIGQHPNMYKLGYWDRETKKVETRRAIFFAGNLDVTLYDHGVVNSDLKIISRKALFDAIQTRALVISSKEALDIFVDGSAEGDHLILLDASAYTLPQLEYRQVLKKFDFFLAMPGVKMPFCHNITEAMSVGSVPVIQDTYANLFSPPLIDNKNCVRFSNVEELLCIIDGIKNLCDHSVREMRDEASSYYRENLVPEAIEKGVLSVVPAGSLLLHKDGKID